MEPPFSWELPINYKEMEKKHTLFLILAFALFSTWSFGQLEKVIIEKYYISDASDASDTIGGSVPVGSTTYRIYVDMYPNSILKKIYGDDNHPFMIKSTAPFYNHTADGQTFAKDFVKARYGEGVLALDTWLTLGETTKTQAGKTYFGVMKDQDTDGSFIGGVNNDGGTAAVSGGLLVNNDPSCGRPLTSADGMDTLMNVPTGWFSSGVTNFVTGADSTIFGSIQEGTVFNSNGFELRNAGTIGVYPDSNQVLIAQLTTAGDISFKLNLEITAMINGIEKTFKYVGSDSVLLADETYHPFMIYPLECGCNDPNFLEYNPKVGCLEPGTCITPVVMGCMDPMACNYDPNANFNVQGLCCYPGSCNGRDIAEVCPAQQGDDFFIEVYPNPSEDEFFLNVYSGMSDYPVNYKIYNSYGFLIKEKTLSPAGIITGESLGLSGEENGVYHLQVQVNGTQETKLLVKTN